MPPRRRGVVGRGENSAGGPAKTTKKRKTRRGTSDPPVVVAAWTDLFVPPMKKDSVWVGYYGSGEGVALVL